MRTRLPPLALPLLLAGTCLLVGRSWAGDEAAKDAALPRYLVRLELGGKTYDLEEGVPTDVTVGGAAVPATVRVLPEKEFEDLGIRFRFPSDMAVAYDGGDGIPTWTLDGQDAVLLVLGFGKEADPEMARRIVVQAIQGAFAQESFETKTSQVRLRLGGKDVPATRMSFEMGALGTMDQDYAFVRTPTHLVAVVVQTSPDEESAEEARRVLGLLDRTFVVTPP